MIGPTLGSSGTIANLDFLGTIDAQDCLWKTQYFPKLSKAMPHIAVFYQNKMKVTLGKTLVRRKWFAVFSKAAPSTISEQFVQEAAPLAY